MAPQSVLPAGAITDDVVGVTEAMPGCGLADPGIGAAPDETGERKRP